MGACRSVEQAPGAMPQGIEEITQPARAWADSAGMYPDTDQIAWFLVGLVALARGVVILDDYALGLAEVAQLARA